MHLPAILALRSSLSSDPQGMCFEASGPFSCLCIACANPSMSSHGTFPLVPFCRCPCHVDVRRMKRSDAGSSAPFPARKRTAEPLRNATVDVLRGSVEEQVLHGSLFAAFVGATAIPIRFRDVNAYANAFAPLLVEEAKQGIRSSFEEACCARRWIHVRVSSVEMAKREVRIRCATHQPRRRTSKDDVVGQVAVLCKAPPPVKDAVQWARADATRAAVAFVSHREGKGALAEADDVEWGLRVPHRNAHEAKQAMEAAVPGQELWMVACGNLVVASRERDALAKCSTMPLLPVLLQPQARPFQPMQMECMPWTPEFMQHLQQAFNPPQLDAIRRACARDPNAPVTLVQGPPGSGKTHCVWGMLNALHLLHFQEHSDRLMRAVGAIDRAPKKPPKSMLDTVLASVEDYTHTQSYVDNLLKNRPRMLICAPSNAATDVLLERVMKRGCVDGRRTVYYPQVVRVGSTDAPLSKAARDVLLENQVANYMALSKVKVEGEEMHIAGELHKVRKAIEDVHGRLTGKEGFRKRATPPSSEEERNALLVQLVSLYQHKEKFETELSRMQIVKTLLRGATQEKKAIMDLEISIVGEAEMVFATLSSCGRNIFGQLMKKFDICIIDEAAQASEVATLQPLQYGCKFCIMVGDPQQLPPTVLSKEAQELLYERSLFERLQNAGMEPILLDIQYRMHPEIRQFPSQYFYNGRLQDCVGILSSTQEPFHVDPLLKPYLFFDVADGKEQHRNRGSLQNVDEVEVVLSLYRHLRKIEPEVGHARGVSFNAVVRKPSPVLVLTPYRAQKDLLTEKFEKLVGKEAIGNLVKIETVDAFQGQEQDIVIFSCVRTSPGGRVGFVNDIRRMNVALTRARKALWVVGCGKALVQAPGGHWAALLDDVSLRGLLVKSKTVNALVNSMKGARNQLQAKNKAK